MTALNSFDQFVLWHPVQVANEKKPRKVPFKCDDASRFPVNPHDPGNWLPHALAVQYASQLGCEYGFVLTANDPFFCVDLDDCLQADGTWSPFALGIINMFPGAFVELSYTGNGLHIFAQAAAPAEHRNKVKGDGWEIEVYSRDRFIAVGTNGRGDASLNHTQALVNLLEHYMPGDKGAGIAWTDKPDAEWKGPDNDDELIRRILSRRPTGAQAFGTSATVQDLWSGNQQALATAYPSMSGKVYDASSADAALCSHLAFWTGKDCLRIDTLFRRSKLMRKKWDRGRDPYAKGSYLYETITNACAATKNVYVEKTKAAPAPPPSVTPSETQVSEVKTRAGLQFLLINDQIQHFAGCVYIIEHNRVLTPDGSLLSPEQFKAVYGGYEFAFTGDNKSTKCAWETFTRSCIANFPKAHGTCFRPELPFGAAIDQEGRRLINTYVPVPAKMREGDPEPFLDCLRRQIPNDADRAILLAYAAACVQHKGVKFQWTPLLQGAEGNGKSLIVRCISKAVGERYTHFPNASDLGNKFNAWILGKLFIGVEEVYVTDRREVLDALKPLITDDRIDIQAKGRDQFTGDNRANFMMCSNHRDAIMKTRNDRRYAVFFTAQQTYEDIALSGMGGMYFPNLYKWLRDGGYEIVSHFLAHYAIPEALNPATECHRAPDTSSTDEAILASLGGAEQEVLSAIGDGVAGFRNGWLSSYTVTMLMKEKNFRLGANKRAAMLERLDYIPHPGLSNGRIGPPLMQEGGRRPILYIHKKDTTLRNIMTPADVYKKYCIDQGYIVTGPVAVANI